jgi:sulfotransferase family protein
MIYGIKQVVKYALGRDIAGRTLAVRPDDTFIVSYPRSGNTWTRFLVANLLHPQEAATFANIERLVPDAEAQSSRYMRRIPSPRTIKSHSYFDPRYPRVIYIVRDPRDVVLSYYDFSRKYRHFDDSYPLERYIGDFATGHLISAGWGTWGENVASWVFARGARPGFLLLRYEDMKERPERELTRIAKFLGIVPSPELLQTTLDRSSADRMREMEKTQGKDWVSTKDKRSDIPFIRTASAGGWKSKLRPEWVLAIEAAWGNIMAQVGYELVTRKAEIVEPQLTAAAIPGEQRG